MKEEEEEEVTHTHTHRHTHTQRDRERKKRRTHKRICLYVNTFSNSRSVSVLFFFCSSLFSLFSLCFLVKRDGGRESEEGEAVEEKREEEDRDEDEEREESCVL